MSKVNLAELSPNSTTAAVVADDADVRVDWWQAELMLASHPTVHCAETKNWMSTYDDFEVLITPSAVAVLDAVTAMKAMEYSIATCDIDMLRRVESCLQYVDDIVDADAAHICAVHVAVVVNLMD